MCLLWMCIVLGPLVPRQTSPNGDNNGASCLQRSGINWSMFLKMHVSLIIVSNHVHLCFLFQKRKENMSQLFFFFFMHPAVCDWGVAYQSVWAISEIGFDACFWKNEKKQMLCRLSLNYLEFTSAAAKRKWGSSIWQYICFSMTEFTLTRYTVYIGSYLRSRTSVDGQFTWRKKKVCTVMVQFQIMFFQLCYCVETGYWKCTKIFFILIYLSWENNGIDHRQFYECSKTKLWLRAGSAVLVWILLSLWNVSFSF